MIRVAIFRNKWDNAPEYRDMDVRALCSISDELPQPLPHMTWDNAQEVKDGTPQERRLLFSPVGVEDGEKRANRNVTWRSALVFDLDKSGTDGQTGLTEHEQVLLFEWLKEFGHEAGVYDSCTSGLVYPRRKLRLVVPLAETIEVRHHETEWRRWCEALPVYIDRQCKDQSRMYYMPAVPSNLKHTYKAEHLEGPRYKAGSSIPPRPEGLVFYTPPAAVTVDAEGRTIVQARTAERPSTLEAYCDILRTPQPRVNDEVDGKNPCSFYAGVDVGLTFLREGRDFEKEAIPVLLSALLEGDKDPGRKAKTDVVTLERAMLRGYKYSQESFKRLVEEEKWKTRLSAVAHQYIAAEVVVNDGGVDWRSKLFRTPRGEPVGSAANVNVVAGYHPDLIGTFRYDVRKGTTIYTRAAPWGVEGRFQDCDLNAATIWFSEQVGTSVAPKSVEEAILREAKKNEYDPFLEYLQGLQWDGQERLDNWLLVYAAANPAKAEWARTVGAKILIAAVARTYKPNSKVDTVPILIGDQGLRKSTFWRSLLPDPDMFLDRTGDTADKDAELAWAENVIIEFSEGVGLTKNDQNSTKAFLTAVGVKVRAHYGRTRDLVLRRAIGVMTTNDAEFLLDETGGRRYWPIECVGRIDVEGLVEARNQLWAEAVVRYCADEQWWLDGDGEALARIEQENVRRVDGRQSELWRFFEHWHTSAARGVNNVQSTEVSRTHLLPRVHRSEGATTCIHVGQLADENGNEVEEGRPLWVTTLQCCDALQLDHSRRSQMEVGTVLAGMRLPKLRIDRKVGGQRNQLKVWMLPGAKVGGTE